MKTHTLDFFMQICAVGFAPIEQLNFGPGPMRDCMDGSLDSDLRN
jgi:hypothetical protein